MEIEGNLITINIEKTRNKNMYLRVRKDGSLLCSVPYSTSEKIIIDGKPKVAFVCVHNSCRSQIAEALGKLLAGDVFDSYSAGTELKDHINQDAVRLMKKIYGIDMEATQRNKLIADIPSPDIVITMGCNVNCPVLPCKYREDWPDVLTGLFY